MAETIGIMSYWTLEDLMEYLFNGVTYNPPEEKWIVLYKSNYPPAPADVGQEVDYLDDNYHAFRISASATGSRFVISGSMAYNQEEYTWGPVLISSAWGTLYGWGIREGEYGGGLIFGGLFDTPIPQPNTGMVISIGEEEMKISLSSQNTTTGGWTAISANYVIDFLTNGSTVAPLPWNPSNGMKLALGRNIVFDAGNNFVSWTEVDDTYTNYTQQIISASSWGRKVYWSQCENIGDIVFTDNATGNWGNVSDVLLYDSTGTYPLFWGHLPSTLSVTPGDEFKISDGAIQIFFYAA